MMAWTCGHINESRKPMAYIHLVYVTDETDTVLEAHPDVITIIT